MLLSFALKILGANSAAPAHNRHQTAQLLMVQNHQFLIDCGEGTQMQLNKYKVKSQKINHIFISHLHGDHYLGLMGLVSTLHLQGRTADLNIYGPSGLADIITLQLKHSETVLNYKIRFRKLNTAIKEVIFEDDVLTIETIPLNHRIGCSGFLFREKPKKRRIIKEKLPQDLSLQNILSLKNGADIYDGKGQLLYVNEALTMPPKKSRSYAYCSDTKYEEQIIAQIKGVDLLYHESTFLSDREERATQTYHSTARQAATIAKKAQVGQLLLGHYSIRYKELQPILEEARQVFDNSQLAIEGEVIEIEE